MVMAPTRQPQGGQEEASAGGLILHRGPLNAALVRAIGAPATGQPVFPRDGSGSGSGLELVHAPRSYSAIQSYDRDVSQWLDLNLNARNINLQPQGGRVQMPLGSATNLVGNRILQAWNIPAAGAWYETPLQQNLAVTAGNIVRIDCSGSLYHSVIPTVTYLGVMLDGAVALDSVQTTTCTLANATMPYGFTTYLGGQITTSGTHRFSLMLYANGGGAGGFWGGAYQCISVTEQRA